MEHFLSLSKPNLKIYNFSSQIKKRNKNIVRTIYGEHRTFEIQIIIQINEDRFEV